MSYEVCIKKLKEEKTKTLHRAKEFDAALFGKKSARVRKLWPESGPFSLLFDRFSHTRRNLNGCPLSASRDRVVL